MTFPLPPSEAAVLGEFVRLLDARLVSEGSTEGGGASVESVASTGEAETRAGLIAGVRKVVGDPSLTEPLFPDKEAA